MATRALTAAEKRLLGIIRTPRAQRNLKGQGYVNCACRDCMEITVAGKGKKHYCSGCRDAGCPDYQGQPGMSQECQRADAYGG